MRNGEPPLQVVVVHLVPSLALIDFRLDSLYGTQNNVALPAFVVRIYLVDERYRVGGNSVIAEGFDELLFEHIFYKYVLGEYRFYLLFILKELF